MRGFKLWKLCAESGAISHAPNVTKHSGKLATKLKGNSILNVQTANIQIDPVSVVSHSRSRIFSQPNKHRSKARRSPMAEMLAQIASGVFANVGQAHAHSYEHRNMTKCRCCFVHSHKCEHTHTEFTHSAVSLAVPVHNYTQTHTTTLRTPDTVQLHKVITILPTHEPSARLRFNLRMYQWCVRPSRHL